jgi:hypothetical protein
VREATEKSTSRKVALKILNPRAYLKDAATTKAVLFEIQVLQRVGAMENNNLLRFVAAHEDVSSTTALPRLTIATELCSGGEVRLLRVSVELTPHAGSF